MTDRTEDERRKLYIAAQITAIVCDAERNAADVVAEALCTEPGFLDRHGDKEDGCSRLAAGTFEAAAEEVEVLLDEHGLGEFLDEVGDDTVWCLTQGYLQTLEQFVEREEPRAMADSIRHDVVALAEGLEEALQLTFDVWEPSDAEVGLYQRTLKAAEARRTAKGQTPATASRRSAPNDSVPAKVGRVAGGVLRAIGGIFR